MTLASCIIVEDEPPALETLRDMIATIADVACVGMASDGETAVRVIDDLRPDLVLLDIELPLLSGLEVLERIEHQPSVIFTTAYDKYAVTAFELGAIDYLLKPFRRDRLAAAIQRFRDHHDATPHSRIREVTATAPLQRLFVRMRDRIVPVIVKTVERFEAEGDYVAMYVAGHRYLVNVPLHEIEQRLDARQFCRVHRSHIVNLDFVAAILPLGAARLEVEMKDGTRIASSRSRSRELRQLVF